MMKMDSKKDVKGFLVFPNKNPDSEDPDARAVHSLVHGTTDGIVLVALLEQMEYHLDTVKNLDDAKCKKIKKVWHNFLPWINC